jgi:hypothetical protein
MRRARNSIGDFFDDCKSIALKLQIGKDDDKKESQYQKYIYHATKGYQYYGESGHGTNKQLF